MLWLPLVVGAGLVVTVFQAHFREEQPSWAVLLAIAFVAAVFLALLPHLNLVLQGFSGLMGQAALNPLYLNPVLKTMGIAYITTFGVQICQEAGEEAISGILELAGKIVILIVALPLLRAILEALFAILGN